MKINHFAIILLFSLFFCACNKQKAPDTAETKKYIATLKAMKYDELKSLLKKDTTSLNKLIKTATFTLQLTSHFSSGEKSTVDKAVAEFEINHNQAKITDLFNEYSKQLYFDQSFRDRDTDSAINLYGQDNFLYKSRFGLTDDNHLLEEKDSLFKPFKSSVVTSEKAYFFNGEKIAKTDIGLKRIDSIQTEISLIVPTNFEKFSIDKSNKTETYKAYTIEIDRIKENIAELKIPIALYSEIIGYQAYNSKNVRMNSSALSTTPVLAIDKKISDSLKELLAIFSDILNEKNEKSGKEMLDQISQYHLDAKNNMANFEAYMITLYKDNKEKIKELGHIAMYDEIANAGKKVLGVEMQFVMVEFPDDIKSIEVFVAIKSVLLQNKSMVKYGNHYLDPKYYDKDKPNIVFYSNKDDYKFGISNQYGEIIIEPKYDELRQVANEYFVADEKLFWLNVAEKKMVQLPQFSSYVQTLKPGYDVFEKVVGGENKSGLMFNREKIIIPFEYYAFEKYEKFIIARVNSDLDDIYDLNLKKLPNKGIQKIYQINHFIASSIKYPALFVAKGSNKKDALIDKNLNLLTSFKYEFINPFYDINNYFIAGIRTPDGSNYLYGIIDVNGKEIVPFMFCNLKEAFDTNGKLKFCLKGKYQSMDFAAFIKKYKKV